MEQRSRTRQLLPAFPSSSVSHVQRRDFPCVLHNYLWGKCASRSRSLRPFLFFFHPTLIPWLVLSRRERINSAPRANLERPRSNRSRPELLVLSPFATMYRAIIWASRKSNRSTQLSINFSISLHRYISSKTHFPNSKKTPDPETRYIRKSRIHRI